MSELVGSDRSAWAIMYSLHHNVEVCMGFTQLRD